MWRTGLVIATGVMAAGAMFAPAIATLEGVAHATPVVATQTPYDPETDPATEPTKFSADPAIPIPRHTYAPTHIEQSSENTSGISIGFLVFLALLLVLFVFLVVVAARVSGR